MNKTNKITKKNFIQALLISICGAFLGIILYKLDLLERFEAKTWDLRASYLSKPKETTKEICLILVDQKSLDWGKNENGLSWPWPRELYSCIINFCKISGAKALALDILFTEPSSYGVQDDLNLEKSILDFKHTAGAVFVSDKKITMPIEEFSKNLTVLCNVQLLPDSDGIYRRVRLFKRFNEKNFPILGLGAYFASLDKNISQEIQKQYDFINNKNYKSLKNKQEVILNFRGPTQTHKSYSAASIIQSQIQIQNGEKPNIDPKELKDKFVFVGFSAPGLYDLRSAPVGGIYTGVEIQATVLDNFLSRDFIKYQSDWILIIFILSLAAFTALLLIYFSKKLYIQAFISITSLIIPIILACLFYINNTWLNLLALELSIFFTIIISLGRNYAVEGKQKRFIKGAFKQYLSPHVIEQIIQNPDKLKLGGERKILTIFFSDLQGFTTISEGLEPEELTSLLNEYLSAMTDIIHEKGGTVDKYEGDAIIAFWNAPLDIKNHANQGVKAALKCQLKLAQMRPVFKARINKDMFMRIGINTGPAVVGNMGSTTRFDYTMLGDSVNLAARLEGVNKEFGTYTMISQTTAKELDNNIFKLRELGKVAVVGRKEPVTIYEPMFLEHYEQDSQRQNILEIFDKALKFYYEGNITQAYEIFESIKTQDSPALAYVKKCQSLLNSDIDKNNWTGVWVMTSK